MKIINDDTVLEFLQAENGQNPVFYIQQLQVHHDFKCGCKITLDNKGSSLFPCQSHKKWAIEKADNKILHKNVH